VAVDERLWNNEGMRIVFLTVLLSLAMGYATPVQLDVRIDPKDSATFKVVPIPPGTGGYSQGTVVTIYILPKQGWQVAEWVGPVFNIEGKRAKIQMDSSQTVAVRLKRAPPTPLPRPTATPFPTVIPVPSATPTLPPKEATRPTPQPTTTLPSVAAVTIHIEIKHPGLDLDGLTLTRGIFGDQVFIGAVQNKTTGTLPGISVSLEFKNQAKNRVVGTRDASILLIGEVGAGERVPFVSGFPESGSGVSWDTVQVTVALDPYGGFLGGKSMQGLKLTELKFAKGNISDRIFSEGNISGLIFNDSDDLLGGTDFGEGFLVGVIGYDAADQVVMVGEDRIKERLEPGWSTDFQIDIMWGTSEKAVRYESRVLVLPVYN
jgi:hypothetical protein